MVTDGWTINMALGHSELITGPAGTVADRQWIVNPQYPGIAECKINFELWKRSCNQCGGGGCGSGCSTNTDEYTQVTSDAASGIGISGAYGEVVTTPFTAPGVTNVV